MKMVARMQKAAAVMQFKLEGQILERRSEWEMDHRRLLHLIDYDNGSIELGGVPYSLRDKSFPTIEVDPIIRTTSALRLDRKSEAF